MKAKKVLALLVSAVLMMTALSGTAMGEEVTEQEVTQQEVTVTSQTVPGFVRIPENMFDLTVYFLNGVTDLPYVDLREWAEVMVTVNELVEGTQDYGLYVEHDDHVFQYTRENGYSMLVDFQEGTIAFDDFDAFLHVPGDSSLLDMVSVNAFDMEGNQIFLQRLDKGSFDRYGKSIEIDLTDDYGISLCYVPESELYLVPLQTMGDLLLSVPYSINTFYSGETVYLFSPSDLGSELGDVYYSAPKEAMSEELASFSYNELCMALDHLYGQKELHDIHSFNELFIETGYKKDLSNTDPDVADGALADFIHFYLDDLHSAFRIPSYRTSEVLSSGAGGLSSRMDAQTGTLYGEAREQADHAISAYEEYGNTAYVTFDHFYISKAPDDYYTDTIELEETDPASETMDTVDLILYAHQQITREDSPIENVVIDLSLNGGGDLDAAVVVAAWFLGTASVSVRNSTTGAISTGTYQVDINLDGVYDEKDSVADRNLFCMTSPYSFSCGNLIPNIFKSSRVVTLIGRESGGGSCSVLPMSTAYGTSFQISSPLHLTYVKNGAYYDIDNGIAPDSLIASPQHFYDREALTEHIAQLF